jgi:hypothetical protein
VLVSSYLYRMYEEARFYPIGYTPGVYVATYVKISRNNGEKFKGMFKCKGYGPSKKDFFVVTYKDQSVELDAVLAIRARVSLGHSPSFAS